MRPRRSSPVSSFRQPPQSCTITHWASKMQDGRTALALRGPEFSPESGHNHGMKFRQFNDVCARPPASRFSACCLTSCIDSGAPKAKSSVWLVGCPIEFQSASMSTGVCVKNPSVSRLVARGSTTSHRLPSRVNRRSLRSTLELQGRPTFSQPFMESSRLYSAAVAGSRGTRKLLESRSPLEAVCQAVGQSRRP